MESPTAHTQGFIDKSINDKSFITMASAVESTGCRTKAVVHPYKNTILNLHFLWLFDWYPLPHQDDKNNIFVGKTTTTKVWLTLASAASELASETAT
jgi:hypothetical protein